jgi:hypothetical protein
MWREEMRIGGIWRRGETRRAGIWSAESRRSATTVTSLPLAFLLSLALALLLLGLLGVCLAPLPADAGEWMEVSCVNPNQSTAPGEGWSAFTSGAPGNGSTGSARCPMFGLLSSAVAEGVGNGENVRYLPPSDSTLIGGSVDASGYAGGYGYQTSATVTTYSPEFVFPSDVIYQCVRAYGECSPGSYSFSTVISLPANAGGGFYIGAGCGGLEHSSCNEGSSAGAWSSFEVHWANFLLSNEATPSASGVGGTLLSPNAAGTAELTLTATDPGGPGVYLVTVQIDGKTLYSGTPNNNSGKCVPVGSSGSALMFDYNQPCPTSESVDLPINTTALANGQHTLKVTVQDAAQNSSVVYDGTITVANSSGAGSTGGTGSSGGTGPTGGTGSTGGTGPTGGTGSTGPTGSTGSTGSAGSSSSGAGSATALSSSIAIGPGSPAVLRGGPNGTNASDQAKLTARWSSTAKELRTAGYGAADRVTGRLTSAAGQAISGATLDVYETPASHGAVASRIGGVSTGPTGSWTLTLPRGISSSTLRFAYRSHVNDTVDAATATLRLRVHAGIALKITPRASSAGQRIFFSGVLHGVPIPEDGKQLVLEARSGREGWIQFNTIHTDTKGRYRASYRFKFSGPITYQFRVLSRLEADFPFLEGASNVVAVYER